MKPANGHVDASRPMPWNRAPDDVSKKFADALEKHKDRVVNRYTGADLDRFTRDLVGTHQQGSSADYHQRQEIRFFRQMEIGRDIDRNDMTASQGMDRLCVNILQQGFKLDPMTGSTVVDDYINDWWKEYAEDQSQVDFQGERDFDQLSYAICRAHFVDGDHLVNPLSTGQFQTIEGHLLRTPYGRIPGEDLQRTIHGVQLNDNRQRVRYWVAEDDINPWQTVRFQAQNYTAVEAFDRDGNPNIFHVKHNFKRTGSLTRGVTVFAPIIHACGLLDDVQFAKLVQQQAVSAWVAQIKRDLEGEYPEDERKATAQEAASLCREGEWSEIDDISAGMIYKGYPGETLNGFSPNVPNPTYLDHAKQITEVIGVNVYLPYIVLMMDASETNFSGWRGAMDQAKMLWKWLQGNFAKAWHRPAFNFRMRQATTRGTEHYDRFLARMLSRGTNTFAHRWRFPDWPYVNPMEDVTANAMEVQKLQNSPRRVQAKQGRDYAEVIVGETLDDNRALIDRAMQIAAELQATYPDQLITWEQVIVVPTPDHISLNTSKAIENEPEPEPAVGNVPGQQQR